VTFTAQSFCALVDFLHLLHDAGYVYRDIRPSNMVMFTSDRTLYIRPVDYGTICKKNKYFMYVGSCHHCSTAVLNQREANDLVKFRPADDLHSLVRTARELVSCSPNYFRSELEQLHADNFGQISAFWSKKLEGYWEQAVIAAEDSDYQSFERFLWR